MLGTIARPSARALTVLAMASLVAALMVAPSVAEDDTTALDNLEAALAFHGGAVPDGSPQAASGGFQAITECFEDDEGDTFDFRSGNPSDEPRADILEHCVNFGPTLSVNLLLAEPTDPEEDPNWQGATFAGWFVDVDGDGEGDYFISLHLNSAGEFDAEVIIVGDDVHACDAAPAFTRDRLAVSNIPSDCIDAPAEVAVSVAMMYDTEPGEEGGEHIDVAPGGNEFTDDVEAEDRTTDRFGGVTRIETAVEIAEEEWGTDDVDVVYIARQDVFPDAVTAGASSDGPILLVFRCAPVPPVVMNYINAADPDTVIALGNQDAICDDVLNEAGAGRNTDRLGGPERMETSVEIAQHRWETATVVFVAGQADQRLVDSVTGGTLTEGPILLVPTFSPPLPATLAEIERLDPDIVIALGGPLAVSDATLEAAAQGRATDRLAGETRFETAIEISQYEFPDTADDVYLTRPDVLADAAVGGTLSGGPILIVQRDAVPILSAVAAEISRVSPDRVAALGRELAVSEEVLQEAANH